MKCIHHTDMDGWCSAAIVKYLYPECELIPMNYGWDFPWYKIEDGETVIMVDFSLPKEDMEKLDERTDFTWIDHHHEAIKKIEEGGFNPKGLRENGKAGCELVWEYYFHDKPMPTIVKMIGRYDVYDLRDERVVFLQSGIRLYDAFPDNVEFWNLLFKDDDNTKALIDSMVNSGRIISAYEKKQNIITAKSAFEVEFEGLRCLAINEMPARTPILESVWDNNKYDAMIFFGLSKRGWKFSLRTDKDINLARIVERRGGSGHPGAASFRTNKLPTEFENINH